MAEIQNRAAENGGIIISDTNPHAFTEGKLPCVVRVIEDAVITTITSPNMENMTYYDGKALTTTDPIIIASISSIQLTSGVVQLIYT